MVVSTLLPLLALAYYLGLTRVKELEQRASLGGIALASILISLKCFSAYKFFCLGVC
jgi:hypothetical protein